MGSVKVRPLFIIMEENVFDNGTLGRILRENMSSNVFQDWFAPARKEARQMVEQLALDELEPTAKMQGLKRAGINPLTAASGVAGAGNSAVPQPESSVNPIGDAAGAVGSVAGAAQNIAAAVSRFSKLPNELENIDADTAQKLAGAGLSNAQTQGVLTDNSYKDEDWKTRLNVQRQQFDNMKQELTNMRATHREIMTHCDEMISQIELNGSLKEYNEALMAKVQEETRWMKELNDWRISHNLHIVDSGIDGYIFDMALRGADISEFDNFISIYAEWRGRTQRAISDAQNASEIESAFDKAFNAALGDAEVAAAFAPYMANIDVVKESAIALYNETISHSKGPIEFAMKFIHTLTGFLVGGLAITDDQSKVGMDGTKPKLSPKSRK